ncbi:TetR/AcrR family transcriptional regulator [Pseudonocardia lutea]|uniref:TetR/AcrR family transcriptional regulator n=1 Tax=Pseudonocardia lutea TaxID=2172015 RepID=A0ABW1I9U9_9PSEU
MAVKRTPFDGDQTRLALITAAEELFADEGVEATSIRSINKAAGVAPAAVHYHFGSKDALLDAVLARRGGVILPQILTRAGELVERRRRPTAHEIVDCVAVPYLELLADDPVGGGRWLRIIAQLSLAQDVRMSRQGDPAARVLKELCEKAYPKADPETVPALVALALNTLIQMIGRTPGDADAEAEAAYRTQLVDFVAGGLDAILRAASHPSTASSSPSAESA